jgi:hypothetical protein
VVRIVVVAVALAGGAWLAGADAARGDVVWTITTATPTQAGTLSLRVQINNVPITVRTYDISLTGKETAAQKAAKVASALDNSSFPITATATGNRVTVESTLGGIFISRIDATSDSTGEVNQLLGMAPGGDPSQLVAIDEYPTQSPAAIPTAGQLATMSFLTDTGKTVAGSVTSDGTHNAGTLLSEFNASTGISWTVQADPVTGRTYFQSPWFDPTSAEVDWNAFAGQSLANFGLTFTPEPTCLPALLPPLLLGCGRSAKRRSRPGRFSAGARVLL